jgi:hypothetical protein
MTGPVRSGTTIEAGAPRVSVSIDCEAEAPRRAMDALEELNGGLDPLVREHALAIVSALLGEARGARTGGGEVAVEAWFEHGSLRVELGDSCVDLGPEAAARGFNGFPPSALEQLERLADRWGISYDGELRLWFEIKP